ncbi:MAG: hypothetical protein IH851_02230 [Armatimonadetes bacterium]|nr:hypothetical protein [Armatimonadota bacterium]
MPHGPDESVFRVHQYGVHYSRAGAALLSPLVRRIEGDIVAGHVLGGLDPLFVLIAHALGRDPIPASQDKKPGNQNDDSGPN